MAIVTINENWRIDIDTWNNTLQRFHRGGELVTFGKMKGTLTKDYWTDFGYYPNISQCLRAIVREEGHSMGDCHISDYLSRLEGLQEEIKV